jgi:hypothetical protein
MQSLNIAGRILLEEKSNRHQRIWGGIKTEKQASAFPDVITRFERQSVLSLFNF